ncbi:WD40-repeat-containing domain protein [Cokeromyces recurvatus]|uniref:WD40-repeat-containing domain protein n=1 Tax=Cokeromyces recurvatus TaxID=90255 RepID=UPI002220AE44|nr:WD40-repeat-containing domain protein [Cokeromyces recurvatus]KAI7906523.1 WD40-repeat-containing domain protein [Cokeromyces recurvatus]
MSNNKVTEPLPPPPPIYIFREHKSTVNHLHLFKDDQLLASCDADGWIIIWKMRTRRPLLKWKGHEASCLKVTTNSMHDTLISQGRDNMIHIWKLTEVEATLTSSIVYNGLGFCKFSYNEKEEEPTLLCFPSKEDIKMLDIYDLTSQTFVLQNIGNTARFGSCMATQLFRTLNNELFVLAGYESGTIALWEIIKDRSTSKLVWHRQEHKEPIFDLSIDSKISFAISSSGDNQICKYSLATGDIIKKIAIKKSGIVALKIRSTDNKIFASGGFDGKIRIFSIKTMKPLAVLTTHKNTVYGLEFGKEDNWLIGGSEDHRVSLWKIF